MDNKYQLMCKKAIKIQENWNPRTGDIISMCQPNHCNTTVVDIIARENYDDKILDFSLDSGEYNEIFLEKSAKIFTDYWSRRFSNQWFDIKDFEITWLPQQEQLQDMLNIGDFTYLVSDFSEWVYQQQGFKFYVFGKEEVKIFNSTKQLWLAYVMKQKYSKVWNGKDWINNG